jgi:hypothetical protein
MPTNATVATVVETTAAHADSTKDHHLLLMKNIESAGQQIHPGGSLELAPSLSLALT